MCCFVPPSAIRRVGSCAATLVFALATSPPLNAELPDPDRPADLSPTCTVPDNDDCATVATPAFPVLTSGSHSFDNLCATTDGPNPTPIPWVGPTTIVNDLWFKYIAECDGFASVAVCWSFPGDPAAQVAAYRDPGNPTVCPCPTQITQSEQSWPPVEFGGGCVCHEGNPLCGPIQAGDCLTIRVGGWDIPGFERVQQSLSLICQPLAALSPWDNRCHGGTNNFRVCGTHADCPGGACGVKNRYLSFLLGDSDIDDVAYKITIVDAPSTPSLNGQVRWLSPPQTHAEGVNSGAFQTAGLQCTPRFAYWGINWNIHVYGPEIQPDSMYEIRKCRASDGICSPPLSLTTAKWGDVATPFGQVNFQDVAALVARFQDRPTAIDRPRAQLRGILVDPATNISFLDVADGVNAFTGKPFPYASATLCP